MDKDGSVNVDETPDGTDMVFQLSGETERLPFQAADPLPGGQVEALHVAGLAALLAHRVVLLSRGTTSAYALQKSV